MAGFLTLSSFTLVVFTIYSYYLLIRPIGEILVTLSGALLTACTTALLLGYFKPYPGTTLTDSAASLARAGVDKIDFTEPTRKNWSEVEYRVRRSITSAGVVRIVLGSAAMFNELRLFDTLQRVGQGGDVAILLASCMMDDVSDQDDIDSVEHRRLHRLLRVLIEEPSTIKFRHSSRISYDTTTIITETAVTTILSIAPSDIEGQPPVGYIVTEAGRSSAIRQNNLKAFQRAWDAASPARLSETD